MYSLCQWGVMDAHLWGAQMGNSWRTTEVRRRRSWPAAAGLPGLQPMQQPTPS